jgi:predicted thioesterase
MENVLRIGVGYTSTQIVTHELTAAHYGSGLVEVFATPAMVGLMENAAMNAVLPFLQAGNNTVGTEICVKHIKATPMGMRVSSEAVLTEIDGRKLVFSIRAWDEEGEIGSGTHTRYVIDNEKFMAKLTKK